MVLKNNISEATYVIKALSKFESKILEISDLILPLFSSGGKILICGNGGSAADAQHIAAEFVGRYRIERPALPAIALSTDSSALTAISNDYGYEQVFSRQIEALGSKGDILLCISTSGNSLNIIKAIEAATAKKMRTITFLGNGGGELKNKGDYEFIVESSITARIQEAHIFLAHNLCELIDNKFAGTT